MGNLLALLVTPANEPERAQVGELAEQVQQATQKSVKLAFFDQGYTGKNPPKPNAGSCCFHAVSASISA